MRPRTKHNYSSPAPKPLILNSFWLHRLEVPAPVRLQTLQPLGRGHVDTRWNGLAGDTLPEDAHLQGGTLVVAGRVAEPWPLSKNSFVRG